jgi:hypothetical protein
MENWHLLTKLNELIGKWVCCMNFPYPNTENQLTSIKFDIAIIFKNKSKRIEHIWRGDYSQLFDDIIEKLNSSSFTKDMLWDSLMLKYLGKSNIKVEKYFVTSSSYMPISKMKKQIIRNKFILLFNNKIIKLNGNECYVNENKDKIKLILPKNVDNSFFTISELICEKTEG